MKQAIALLTFGVSVAAAQQPGSGRMIQFAKAMTDDEIKAAATYFSSMKWTPWVKVVEPMSAEDMLDVAAYVASRSP